MGITIGHAEGLRARALDPALAEQLGVRSMPGRDGKMVLAFDYRQRGKIHNTKQRYAKGDMPWTETGRPLILWGIDDLAPAPMDGESLIIVEGEMDRIALRQVGYSRVVSVPNGAPSREGSQSDRRYQFLYQTGDDLLPDIAKWKTVILATDGDRPGMALRDDLSVRIGPERCLWVPWPEGCKDANDVLRTHGAKALIDCISGAKKMWLDLVCSMSELPDQPEEEGLEMGFDIMDGDLEADGLRMPAQGFCTVVGPAGSGKSVFMRQVAWNFWRQHRMPFGITALEEPGRPRYQRVFRRYATGLPYKDWTQAKLALADEEIDYACKIIQRPSDGLMYIDDLINIIKFSIEVYGLRMVIIDPMNEVEIERPNERSDVTSRSAIMQLKMIADHYKVLIVAVTHPPVDVFRRKKPSDLWTLYDVEGGRHWAGKSDAGFGIWRPHPKGPTLVHASKLKRHEIFGKPNLFLMEYNADMDSYSCVRAGYDIMAQILIDLEQGLYDRPSAAAPFKPKPARPNGPIFSFGGDRDED